MNKKFTKLIAALALLAFMAPNMAGWGQTRDEVTIYSETFGDNGSSNTAYASYSGYSATTDMFVGTGAVSSHYTGSGKVGKNSVDVSTGYTGASGKSAAWYTAGSGNNTTQALIISGISIQGYTDLQLSFGMLKKNGTSSTNVTSVTYSIDNGTAQSFSFTHPTDANWHLISGGLSGTGESLTITFTMTTSGGFTNRYDDIKVTGTETTTPTPTTYTVTFDCDGGTGCPEDITGIEDGQNNFTVPSDTPTKEHYTFDQFYLGSDNILYESGETYTINSDLELTASWTINKSHVTLSDDGTDAELYATYGEEMLTEGDVEYINYGTELTLGAEDLPSNHTVVWTVKNTNNVDVTAEVLSGTTVTVPDYDIIISGTVTEIPTYTITFDPGTGTCAQVPTDYLAGTVITEFPTATPSAACVSRGWTFAGWAIAHVADGTTTNPTVSSYTVNGDAILYAVYSVTEGGSVFDNTAGGDFMIYATVDGNNYYATGTGNKISTTTTASEAAVYTFEKPQGYGNGEYAIKYGSNYITYNSGTNLDVASTPYKWTITNSETGGSWCIASQTEGRGFVFQEYYTSSGTVYYSHQFGGYNITNIDGDDYFAVEIGGVNTTTYATDPECLEQVATPTFALAEGTYTGAQDVTINCTTQGASILYKTAEEGEWQTYSAAIPVSTTTTIWAKATKEGMDDSEVAEATYTIQYTLTVDIEHVDWLLYDYTSGEWVEIEVDSENHALVPQGAEVRISVEMVDDCYVLNGFNVTYGSTTIPATDHMDDDGTYGFTMPASNATLTDLTSQATQYTLTVTGLDNISGVTYQKGSESEIFTLDANNQASLCEGIVVEVYDVTTVNGCILQSVQLDGVELTKTSGVYTFNMPSDDATLTFTTVEIPTYTLVTATDQIVSGKHYIIASGTNGNVKAMGGQNTNNRYAVGVTAANNTITYEEDVFEFVINGPEYITKNNEQVAVYTIYDVSNKGYLYAAGTTGSSNKNYLKTQSFNDANGQWTIAISENKANIQAQGSNLCNKMRYNSSNNGLFSCYASGQDDIYLYKKDNDTNYEFYKDIAGHNASNGGWNFIASPIAENVTATVPKENADLYFYDEKDHYWRNYKVAANASGFNYANGKGFLYANNNNVTLSFAGATVCTDNTKAVGVTYNALTSSNQTNSLAGWNLVGNPYPHTAYLSQSFYTVVYDSENEEWVLTANEAGTVAICTGAMVKAGENQTSVLFSKNAPSNPNNGSVQMTVGQQTMDRGIISTVDNAIVSFNEGNELQKFYLGQSNANIYIPQGNKEYAIACAEGQGELPVNFRANADGQYTLTVNPEGIEMNYLHLIDNMTGADVDLLATPNYTFNATTRDYESRFRLVFSANNAIADAASEETFAFFSNGSLIVNNEGEATLQVVDVMGRVVSNQAISGTSEVSLNQVPGVYVLRLISGDNVRTQKVIVK